MTGGIFVARYCPSRKEGVVYLECLECENKRKCKSERDSQISRPSDAASIIKRYKTISKERNDISCGNAINAKTNSYFQK